MFIVWLIITLILSILLFARSSKTEKNRKTKLLFSISLSWVYSVIMSVVFEAIRYKDILTLFTFLFALILFISGLLILYQEDERENELSYREVEKWLK